MRDALKCLALLVALSGTVGNAVTLTSAPNLAVDASQVTLWWTTDVSATTEVYFGPTPQSTYSAYPGSSIFPAPAGTVHSRTLSHLAPGTYYYRVRSADGSGGSVQSCEGVFAIAPRDFLSELQFNGDVRALASLGSTLYVGGGFTEVGLRQGTGLVVDATSGVLAPDQPQISGTILATAPDGKGGFYIGGTFSSVGALHIHSLAHLLPDHGVDPFWNIIPDAQVLSLAITPSTLYIGGAFNRVNGTFRNGAASVDLASGTLTAWDPTVNSWVYAIAVSGSTVYLGGSFTGINVSVARNYAAAVDATSGTVTAWNPNPSWGVTALAVSGSTVYLGGGFTAVNGGTPRSYVAAVDATSGAAKPWNPGPNQAVQALAVSGSTVYLGGSFSTVNGTGRNWAAAVDATSGALTAWNPGLSSNTPWAAFVSALGVSGSTVYLAGSFDGANGGTARHFAAAVDATSGALTPWNPDFNERVLALAVSGSNAYVGGDFTTANPPTVRNYAAAVDLTSGALTAWNPNLNSQVNALATSGSTVYLGGSFTSAAGGTPRHLGAAVDATSGALTAWDPNINSGNFVDAFVVSGSTIYIGGSFFQVNGGTPRNNLIAVDATSGILTPWNPNPNPNSFVNALALSGSTLYLGGLFTNLGNSAAAVSTVSGAPTAWHPGPDSFVNALLVSGSTVYMGGQFQSVDGGLRSYGAAVDADAGALEAWNPNLNFIVQGLAESGPSVYIAGQFDTVNGTVRRGGAVSVDPTSGVVTAWNPDVRGTAYAILPACDAGFVAVGGSFRQAGRIPQADLVLYPAASACSPSAPGVVATFSSTPPTGSIALQGAAMPNLADTTAWFRYGASKPGTCSDSFGMRLPLDGGTLIDAGFGWTSFSQTLPRPADGTYYFCAVASNSVGTSFSEILPFTVGGACGVGVMSDAGTDAGVTADAGTDAGVMSDAGTDAGVTADAGTDAGVTADAGTDAGVMVDAGTDAGVMVDAGTDAGVPTDAGVDAGTPDSGVDGGTATDGGSDGGIQADGGEGGQGSHRPSRCGCEGTGGSSMLGIMGLMLLVGVRRKRAVARVVLSG